MLVQELKKLKLPDEPGVYEFIDARRKILYIGKAASLRERVRSYFANDLLHTRGKHLVDMVTLAHAVRFIRVDSVLDAIILEASLIKKHQPLYNTKEKDDKSWNYVVITKEAYPAVLTIRERTMFLGEHERKKYRYTFGPFPQGTNLKEALKIVRKIFPFRDTCSPAKAEGVSTGKPLAGKPCFNRQIGLCPGVCTGEISKEEYAERIRQIALFFAGRKSVLLKQLERSMRTHAKALEFEAAGEYKRMIFALKHIKDVALINSEVRAHSQKTSRKRTRPFRIEAYDVAHISGRYTVGVMTVVEDGRPKPSNYRKFKIRPEVIRKVRDTAPVAEQGSVQDATGQTSEVKVNDVLHLEQVLLRRLRHKEWPRPDIIVVDGGVAQKRRAEKAVKEAGLSLTVLSVVKDERHKPRMILGNKELALSYERGILIANGEAHRFAVAYHRKLRGRLPL
ncbi:MAG: hypothetical protein A2942_04450 [Candidatus Lloydbacteria bacterium RIFCSPLOWO2_01_FULL_50_20]|uniref:Excinuclease ABC subunit C n=1 Tax=Candidatus Lloydbacteria bacterium RIFCSPLOWO2_01_FULL_50_20 TaxID=1798665 RepID=A0A1G2DF95_9BACT|nr:MAG: hypothetical protein A3C13_03045 [Candidatus Lloydbacteria bacterium RIFCSPHIGHO2_02_FULL_50_11]OGZ11468.1 MAG: hypothetical protein A2942_04450 [Candidatus Lloydbacteria bacterium RIFCSPLOWO2_01_FULL_50_20]